MKLFSLLLILSAAGGAAEVSVQDSLDALRGLKSVTEVGVNFRDYSKRVLDAKVIVDKFLANTPKEDAQHVLIENIMTLHVLALKAWAAKIQRYSVEGVGEVIMAKPEFATCGDMPDLIAKATAKWEADKSGKAGRPILHLFTPAENLGNTIGLPTALWRCASTMLDR